MTETEWFACTDFRQMLEFLRGEPLEKYDVISVTDFVVKIGEGLFANLGGKPRAYAARQWRLFNCACCRCIWELIAREDCQHLIEISEAFADGLQTKRDLARAASQAELVYHQINNEMRKQVITAAWAAVDADAEVAAYETADTVAQVMEDTGMVRESASGDFAHPRLCATMRDIFGNPFRSVTLDPSWRAATVVSLAQAIYSERTFDDLPILADALEDAGCTHADILNHCRQPGVHVRGCWVVDLI